MSSNQNKSKKNSKNGKAVMKHFPGNTQYQTGMMNVIVSMPKSVRQFFPSRFRAWAMSNYQHTNITAVGASLTFKQNCTHLRGPRINNAGAYAPDVPAGQVYLLSGNNASGAQAPYLYGKIIRTEVYITALMTAATGTLPALLYCTFGSIDNNSGISTVELPEQPMTAYTYLSSDTVNNAILQTSISSATVAGVSEKAYIVDPEYDFTASADCSIINYCLIGVRALDGASTPSYHLEISFRDYYEFSQLNNFSPTTPASLKPEIKEDYVLCKSCPNCPNK